MNDARQEPAVSVNTLSKMFVPLGGAEKSQPGYHWRRGWNAALRRAMDYAAASAADLTDWRAIARVQSAKLSVALDEPGAAERLSQVMNGDDWKTPPARAELLRRAVEDDPIWDSPFVRLSYRKAVPEADEGFAYFVQEQTQ